MVVDSDGTLHFGPRTVPPPTLESAEARQSYARQMFARAPTDGSELINPYLPSTSSCLSVRHESGNALLPSEEQKCTGVIWKRRPNLDVIPRECDALLGFREAEFLRTA